MSACHKNKFADSYDRTPEHELFLISTITSTDEKPNS